MTTIKNSALTIAFCFVSLATIAQQEGKVYPFIDFDKVELIDLNGKVEIELGKAFQISVSGKENAAEQVQVTKIGDRLLVKLDPAYISDWRNQKTVNVTISMPEMSRLHNSSNADVRVRDFVGRYLGIKNRGNGNIVVLGSIVDQLDIVNNGNGNVEAKDISSKRVDASKTGNGDIAIRTDADFDVSMSGNGDIVNYGKGRARLSSQSGNGRVVYRD